MTFTTDIEKILKMKMALREENGDWHLIAEKNMPVTGHEIKKTACSAVSSTKILGFTCYCKL
jgi:hypothetical protein